MTSVRGSRQIKNKSGHEADSEVNKRESWREVIIATWQQHPGESTFITEL